MAGEYIKQPLLIMDGLDEMEAEYRQEFIQKINGSKEYLSQASEEELLWLSLAIESALDEKGKFAEFFSEREYGLYSKSKVKTENEAAYPVVLKNVLEVGANQWVTVININQLYELYKKQLINYKEESFSYGYLEKLRYS